MPHAVQKLVPARLTWWQLGHSTGSPRRQSGIACRSVAADFAGSNALSAFGPSIRLYRGQQRVKGRNRYRDSPLRGGASLIALRLGRASIAGRAEPSITVAAARSSSTVQHELRCYSRSRRSPAFTCREVMRIVVLQETPVPGRASRCRRSVHISHSCFAGLQRRSPFGSQLPGEMDVLPFCSSKKKLSDPRITFPYLLKIRTSTLGLCALSTGSRPAMASLA